MRAAPDEHDAPPEGEAAVVRARREAHLAVEPLGHPPRLGQVLDLRHAVDVRVHLLARVRVQHALLLPDARAAVPLRLGLLPQLRLRRLAALLLLRAARLPLRLDVAEVRRLVRLARGVAEA